MIELTGLICEAAAGGGESDPSPGKAALARGGGSGREEEVGARLAGDCQLRRDDSGSSSARPTAPTALQVLGEPSGWAAAGGSSGVVGGCRGGCCRGGAGCRGERRAGDDTRCGRAILRLCVPEQLFFFFFCLRVIMKKKMQGELPPSLTVCYLQSLPPCQRYRALQKTV